MTSQDQANGDRDDDRAAGETAEPGRHTEVDQRLAAQLDLIIGADGIPGAAVYPSNWRELGYFEFIYRENFLLVRDQDVPLVELVVPARGLYRRGGGPQIVLPPGRDPDRGDEGTPRDDAEGTGDDAGSDADRQDRARPGTRGLVLYEVADQTRSVLDHLQTIDDAVGVGVATPDHLLYVVRVVSHCPATEPESVRADARPVPDYLPPQRERDVSVAILDSGWIPDAGQRHAWLHDVEGQDEDTYDPAGSDNIQSYSGHGTFCAGVLRAVAPRTEVYVARTFYRNGGVFESDIAPQVVQAVSRGADIISLSAGTHTRKDLPPLGFQLVKEIIESYKGVVLVCAAGNDSSRQPFFPAALDWTVSVGALSTDWQHRAWFSNYGGWVDCYAPGEDLVNAFPVGRFTCIEPPNIGQVRTFEGMARWSGTSFATPLVAGLIADRMSRTGENGKQAARAVLRQARENFRPGVGPMLLPKHDDGYGTGPRPGQHDHGHHDHDDHGRPGREHHRHHHG